jgi:hypothetical protein
LQAFIKNLKNGLYHKGTLVNGKFVRGDYSGEKPIVFILYVIEYQHRGLPHAHIVYRVSGRPHPLQHQESDIQRQIRQEELIRFIDGYTEVLPDGTEIIHLPHVSVREHYNFSHSCHY